MTLNNKIKFSIISTILTFAFFVAFIIYLIVKMSGDEKKDEEEVNYTEKLLKEKESVNIACNHLKKRLEKKVNNFQNKEKVKTSKKSKIPRAVRIHDFLEKQNSATGKKNGFYLFKSLFIPNLTGNEQFNDYSDETEIELNEALHDDTASVSSITKAKKINLEEMSEEQKNIEFLLDIANIIEDWICNQKLLKITNLLENFKNMRFDKTEIENDQKFNKTDRNMIEFFASDLNKQIKNVLNKQKENPFYMNENLSNYEIEYNNQVYTVKEIIMCFKIFFKNELINNVKNFSIVDWVVNKYKWVRLTIFDLFHANRLDIFKKISNISIQILEMIFDPYEIIISQFVNYRRIIYLLLFEIEDFSLKNIREALSISENEKIFHDRMLRYCNEISVLNDIETKELSDIFFSTSKFDEFAKIIYENNKDDFNFDIVDLYLKNPNLHAKQLTQNERQLKHCVNMGANTYKLILLIQRIDVTAKKDKFLNDYKIFILKNINFYIENLIKSYEKKTDDKFETNYKHYIVEIFKDYKNLIISEIFEFKNKYYTLEFFIALYGKGNVEIYKINNKEHEKLIEFISFIEKKNFCIFEFYRTFVDTIDNLYVFLKDIINEENDVIAEKIKKSYLEKFKTSILKYSSTLEDFLNDFWSASGIEKILLEKFDNLNKNIILNDFYRKYRDNHLKIKYNN